MDKPASRASLLFAIIVLLLAIYIGSYFALAMPSGQMVISRVTARRAFATREHYRWGAHRVKLAFWPLEQIDRRIRPEAWATERIPIPGLTD